LGEPLKSSYRTAIRERHSTRRYTERAVPESVLSDLQASARRAMHLRRPGARVARVDGPERVARILSRFAGMYGLVEGAPHLLVGLLEEETDPAKIDLGYALEQVVLEATRLGLATCWITGTFHPGRAAAELDIESEEAVAAVVALGYPRLDPLARLHDTVIRGLAGAHDRLPLEKIVFAERWGQPWSPEGADPILREVLECARLAPSATNRQPWRFVVSAAEGQGPIPLLLLGLTRRAPIDAGIVMSHVKLVAEEQGYVGAWRLCWEDATLASALDLPASALAVGRFEIEASSSGG